MEHVCVRLLSLSVKNIKNISNGEIELGKIPQDIDEPLNNSIMGIYGQNGSGKTAIVDAMYLLQILLKGEELPHKLYKYIKNGEKEAGLKYRFYINWTNKNYDIEYSFKIRLLDEKRFILSNEKLYGSYHVDGEWSNRKTILEYNVDDKDYLFKPNYRNEELLSSVDNFVQAKVAQQFTQDYDEEKKVSSVYSLLFSKKMETVYKQVKSYHDIAQLIKVLSNYAKQDLIIIQNEHLGLIDINMPKMFFHVNMEEDGNWVGLISVNVEGKTILRKEAFHEFSKVIEQISTVINALVPDVTLQISNVENKYTMDGEEGVSFELITLRENRVIPFECESAGIKKLISICNALIACYNRQSVCLVIDEFDSGIFEYLLGQLLEIMQENAKGQLIFTSHNLRALEVLNNSSLVFTTVNPAARYSNLKYIKNTQNKRLSYLRAVYLGGQDIEFYQKTSQSKIKKAFRKSWR